MVTLAEIRSGIERMPVGRRRDGLKDAADTFFDTFQDLILPFDLTAASTYAPVVVRRERAGLPTDPFDAQIAAICRVHGAILATRNTKDFRQTGLKLVDPWTFR